MQLKFGSRASDGSPMRNPLSGSLSDEFPTRSWQEEIGNEQFTSLFRMSRPVKRVKFMDWKTVNEKKKNIEKEEERDVAQNVTNDERETPRARELKRRA